VSNAQLPAHVVQAASTIRAGTGATAGRNDARKKDKESVKYATKTFPGTGFQSQSNGQLCICWRIAITVLLSCFNANMPFIIVVIVYEWKRVIA